MKKRLKKLPKFKNEDQEREFWDSHSSIGYFDMSKAMIGLLFANLKLSSQPVSLWKAGFKRPITRERRRTANP